MWVDLTVNSQTALQCLQLIPGLGELSRWEKEKGFSGQFPNDYWCISRSGEVGIGPRDRSTIGLVLRREWSCKSESRCRTVASEDLADDRLRVTGVANSVS